MCVCVCVWLASEGSGTSVVIFPIQYPFVDRGIDIPNMIRDQMSLGNVLKLHNVEKKVQKWIRENDTWSRLN